VDGAEEGVERGYHRRAVSAVYGYLGWYVGTVTKDGESVKQRAVLVRRMHAGFGRAIVAALGVMMAREQVVQQWCRNA
jgi:hypothetical protein